MKGVIAAVVLLCVLAGAGWFWWSQTPTYAVDQASNAIKQHNVENFHHWVDVDSVSSSAIDDLSGIPIRSTGSDILERVLGFTIISFFKPTLVGAMGKQIDAWVEHVPKAKSDSGSGAAQDDEDEPEAPKSLLGAIVAAVKPPSLKQVLRDYGLTKKNYRGLGSTDTKEHVAHVGLRFFSPKAQREVEIMLQLNNNPGHWQVDRISNLHEIVPVLAGG
jgi:hypothetical protein